MAKIKTCPVGSGVCVCGARHFRGYASAARAGFRAVAVGTAIGGMFRASAADGRNLGLCSSQRSAERLCVNAWRKGAGALAKFRKVRPTARAVQRELEAGRVVELWSREEWRASGGAWVRVVSVLVDKSGLWLREFAGLGAFHCVHPHSQIRSFVPAEASRVPVVPLEDRRGVSLEGRV
jgi:hypothetical protein